MGFPDNEVLVVVVADIDVVVVVGLMLLHRALAIIT